MKSKILIPVDFTDFSRQAINYACLLHQNMPHEINLIHVFTDHSNTFYNIKENAESQDYRVEDAKRDLQELIEICQIEFPNINFNAIFKTGNLFETLRKTVSEDDSYKAIVMGTKGSSGLDALLLGSNMFEVFQNSKVPVLAVPKTDKKIHLDKIGLLCNFKDGELDVLKQAIELYGTNFEILLIHVNTNNESIAALDAKFKEFINKIIDETGIENISYVIKAQAFFVQYKEDIASAINSVISDELIDVLLVTKSKKGFLRKIIEENVVKQMAYQIQIPKFFGKTN